MYNFTHNIDGYNIFFYAVATSILRPPLRWCWCAYGESDLIDREGSKILRLLNHDPPIPAVQLWLSAGQYGGMTLEEFLESTNG